MNYLKNILLVEDDKDDQYFFTHALGKIEKTYLQDIASNGLEALDKLEHCNKLPDMIFMDVNMPQMDGISCLAEIIKNPRLKNIPVVFLSSAINESGLLCAMGAKAFIQKPLDETMLQQSLEKAINAVFLGTGYQMPQS